MRAVEKTPFGVWAAALPSEICDAIVEEGQKLAKQKATINEARGVDKKIRDGKVAWFSKDNWIEEILFKKFPQLRGKRILLLKEMVVVSL